MEPHVNIGDKLFQDGWYAALNSKLPLPSGPTGLGNPAMAINSPYTRRDHQVRLSAAAGKA
jgi:hypothetical protein